MRFVDNTLTLYNLATLIERQYLHCILNIMKVFQKYIFV